MKLSPELLSYNVVRSNILEIYEQAELVDWTEGKNWYSEAHSFAVSISKKYDIPLIVASGLIACLSPLKSWEYNKQLVKMYLEGVYKHTGTQIDKCHRIVKDGTYAGISGILGGLKTRAFFNNIYLPNQTNHVCLDRHQAKIATGLYIDTLTDYQYKTIAESHRKLAKELSITPQELQCITWVKYRKIKIKHFRNKNI